MKTDIFSDSIIQNSTYIVSVCFKRKNSVDPVYGVVLTPGDDDRNTKYSFGTTTDPEQCEEWCKAEPYCVAYLWCPDDWGSYANHCYGRDYSNDVEHTYSNPAYDLHSGFRTGCLGM